MHSERQREGEKCDAKIKHLLLHNAITHSHEAVFSAPSDLSLTLAFLHFMCVRQMNGTYHEIFERAEKVLISRGQKESR